MQQGHRISSDIHALISDVSYWIENKTYPFKEIAARFHHRLVFIHPFPNGNGRFSRMVTNLLLIQYGEKTFSWGGGLTSDSERRKSYISALREADKHNIFPLLDFIEH